MSYAFYIFLMLSSRNQSFSGKSNLCVSLAYKPPAYPSKIIETFTFIYVNIYKQFSSKYINVTGIESKPIFRSKVDKHILP